ncbi:hypothetical protein D3C87_1952940 [compost metagenome]
MCLFDGFEMLAVNGESGQLDGEEAISIGVRHHDAEGFPADFDNDWLVGLGPVETAFLHGWILHLRIAQVSKLVSMEACTILAGNAGVLSED